METENNFKFKLAPKTAIYVGHLSSQLELASFPHSYEQIYALEVRGNGDLSAATGFRDWREPYWAVGSDYYFSSCAELLGENYLNGRVLDILAAVKLLREQGAREIDLIGRGVNSVAVTLAAALDGDIRQVTLIDAPKSWEEMATQAVERRPQSMMMRGILGKCDLPDIYKTINVLHGP